MEKTNEIKRTQLTAIVINQLNEGRAARIPASGTSMYPSIQHGDLLTIKKVPFITLAIGDVIAFDRNSQIIVHRVIKIKSDEETIVLKTKGDSVFQIDKNIDSSNFVGKVVCLDRNKRTTSLENGKVFTKGKRIAYFYFWFTPIFWFRKLIMIKLF